MEIIIILGSLIAGYYTFRKMEKHYFIKDKHMKSLTTDKAYNDLKIKYDHLYNDHVNLTTELRNRGTEIMSLLHEMEDCKKKYIAWL